MRIGRLKLGNWKNFQAAECKLLDRAFFVGPNASGKSNLFDAIRFLRDLTEAQGGGLQAAVAKRHGLSAIRWIDAKRGPQVSIQVDVVTDDAPRWRYELAFDSKKANGDKRPKVTLERVICFETNGSELTKLERPNNLDDDDPERLTETALEQTSANADFRELADFFRSIRYLNVVPQIIRDPARTPQPEGDPFGGDLLNRINSTPPRTRESRLTRMKDALKIAVPQFDALELEIDTKGIPHLKARYAHWRPRGAWQREDQFSDGTLRLLGLIWALQERGGPILIEEPELSLNAAVVSQLPQMITRATRGRRNRPARQTLISTHSPDLLAAPGIGLDEVFTLEPSENGTQVLPASTIPGAEAMLANRIPLPEIVLPRTRPKEPERLGQLELF